MNKERRERIVLVIADLRAALDRLPIDEAQQVADAEREALHSLPESLRGAERGQAMEVAAEALDEVQSSIDEAQGALEEAIELLEGLL